MTNQYNARNSGYNSCNIMIIDKVFIFIRLSKYIGRNSYIVLDFNFFVYVVFIFVKLNIPFGIKNSFCKQCKHNVKFCKTLLATK